MPSPRPATSGRRAADERCSRALPRPIEQLALQGGSLVGRLRALLPALVAQGLLDPLAMARGQPARCHPGVGSPPRVVLPGPARAVGRHAEGLVGRLDKPPEVRQRLPRAGSAATRLLECVYVVLDEHPDLLLAVTLGCLAAWRCWRRVVHSILGRASRLVAVQRRRRQGRYERACWHRHRQGPPFGLWLD